MSNELIRHGAIDYYLFGHSRHATPTDVRFIYSMLEREAANNSVVARSVGDITDSITSFVLFDVNGRPRAICSGTKYTEEVDDEEILGELRSVMIHPDWQGLGLGSATIPIVIDDLEKQGVTTIIARTDKPDYFKKFGFSLQKDGNIVYTWDSTHDDNPYVNADVHIRQADGNDIQELYELAVPVMDDEHISKKTIDQVAAHITAGEIYIYELNKKIAGTVWFDVHQPKRLAEVRQLVLHPSLATEDVKTALVRNCLAMAKNAGIPHVIYTGYDDEKEMMNVGFRTTPEKKYIMFRQTMV